MAGQSFEAFFSYCGRGYCPREGKAQVHGQDHAKALNYVKRWLDHVMLLLVLAVCKIITCDYFEKFNAANMLMPASTISAVKLKARNSYITS